MHREPIVPCLMPVDDTVRMVVPLLFQSVILAVLPRPSFSPSFPVVILAEGGNPGWCFPLKNWIPEQGSRMTEGRKRRTTPTVTAWIPEQVSRMTEGREADDGGVSGPRGGPPPSAIE